MLIKSRFSTIPKLPYTNPTFNKGSTSNIGRDCIYNRYVLDLVLKIKDISY